MPQKITELLDRLERNLVALGYAQREFYDMDEIDDATMMNREVQATTSLLQQFGRLDMAAVKKYLKGE